ncbi:MAG TPA: hypothetical protein VIU37_06630, partial [Candidatus Limnocylindrales bacterium]
GVSVGSGENGTSVVGSTTSVEVAVGPTIASEGRADARAADGWLVGDGADATDDREGPAAALHAPSAMHATPNMRTI